MNDFGPQCQIVESCGCLVDHNQKKLGANNNKAKGIWKKTTPQYIAAEQAHVSGDECKVAHDGTPSDCQIDQSLYEEFGALPPKGTILPPDEEPPAEEEETPCPVIDIFPPLP